MEIGEFFEDVNDALKAAVLALGGYKKVGPMMRPELPLDQAVAWVRHCLDASRREKFNPDQVMLILREARKANFHAAFEFVAADTGYKATPVDREQQAHQLQEVIAANLEQLNRQMASLAKLKGSA